MNTYKKYKIIFVIKIKWIKGALWEIIFKLSSIVLFLKTENILLKRKERTNQESISHEKREEKHFQDLTS